MRPGRRGSGRRDRLPVLEPCRDQLSAEVAVGAVQDLQIRRIRTPVLADRAGLQARIRVRAGGEVAACPIGGFEQDLAGALEPRCLRVARPLTVPEVEDARRVLLLLGGLAPVAGGQGAALLPRAPRDLEQPEAVAHDPQEADGRRLAWPACCQRVLPPEPLDVGTPALVLDRLAQLLTDPVCARLGSGFVIPDRGEAEKVGRELRAARVED